MATEAVVGLTRPDAGVNQPVALTLYVHLPWCIRKCPYCDFNSHQQADEGIPEARYIDALIADLDRAVPTVWGRSVHAIFLGGGTPSLFSAESIDRLLSAIRARLRVVADAEVTLEANPGSFEAQRFAEFANAGVTRLSVGVQSFDDTALRQLGRVHDSKQAEQAIRIAAEHFETFNLDMMFALPGQDMRALEQELARVREISPPHWSCYHLTMEPNTYFAKFPPPKLPDDDLAADMLDAVVECGEQIGLARYEVSAYARDNHRCQHNLNYWQFGDYLGIGAGAHGKVSSHERIVRTQRYRHPEQYMNLALDSGAEHGAIELTRSLGRDDRIFEFMLNGLRLVDGVSMTQFCDHTGLNASTIGAVLAQAAEDGLLSNDPTRIQATEFGMAHLNELQMRFLK